MTKRKYKQNFMVSLLLVFGAMASVSAQVTERERPAEWKGLIEGARFLDRFENIPVIGQKSSEVWGADGVKPRYVDNGIEDAEWSYWGGNVLKGDDGKYHLFVCRWSESSPKGHMEWPHSKVVHAVADHSFGPFKVKETIGSGHNPEAYRLKNGGYIIYVIDKCYYADNMNGPWEERKLHFDARDRKIPDGLSNLTFAQREDGSYIMMCRGGSIWFSRDGQSTFNLVTTERVYPPYDGRYEDPVIWRTNIQYHMIVHDWLGRIAYYQRSADGIHWKLEPGEAYIPGMAKYEDGTFEDWFKFERIKVFQDEYGRATQANFAVIDTLKHNDKPYDRHSSKNIAIPLTKGRLLTILNDEKIDSNTNEIRLRVASESDFNAKKDMNLKSLRFGASEEVNFGRGSKLIRTEKDGKDLILVFDGKGNGIGAGNFAAKLLGKTKEGTLLFGYARLPKYDYLKPALSARRPKFELKNGIGKAVIDIDNFGQRVSSTAELTLEYRTKFKWMYMGQAKIPAIKPFEKTSVEVKVKSRVVNNELFDVRITVTQQGQSPVVLQSTVSTQNVR